MVDPEAHAPGCTRPAAPDRHPPDPHVRPVLNGSGGWCPASTDTRTSGHAAPGINHLVRELLAIAELELELVTAGRGDELEAVHDRRDAAIAQLPEELAAPARDTLRLALGIQRQAAVALAAALDDHGRELASVGRGRTAARGYTPAGLDPRRVLDRTA